MTAITSVVSVKELPRTYEGELGQRQTAKRRWVCVLADNQQASVLDIFVSVFGPLPQGATTYFGSFHPDLTWLRFRKWSLNEGYEGSPYHVEFVAEYGLINPNDFLLPHLRPTTFSVDGALGEYPATFFYFGTGNSVKYPLTNSAYDFFPGLMTTEGVARITISKNFQIPPPPTTLPSFPSAWPQALNHVNSDLYWGCAPGTLRIDDVDVTQEREEFGGSVVEYWKATAVAVYRQSGHVLQLPDVGFNAIVGGQKQRAMVFDFNNGEWLPSPNPIGLDGFGAPSPTGYPQILPRRVNPEMDFLTLFGTPPQ